MTNEERASLAKKIEAATTPSRLASLTDPRGHKTATVRLFLSEWEEIAQALAAAQTQKKSPPDREAERAIRLAI